MRVKAGYTVRMPHEDRRTSYLKAAFDPVNLAHAKDIVLSPDPLHPNKFSEETEFLVDFIEKHSLADPGSLVLDFGCGMGRVARRIIGRIGCRVVGVDPSEGMRICARAYVGSPELFDARASYDGTDIDLVLAVFVLQHTEHPEREVETIARALKPGGRVLLVDGVRLVPSGVDARGYVVWRDDGADVQAIMARHFEKEGTYGYWKREDDYIVSIWRKTENSGGAVHSGVFAEAPNATM